MTNIQTYKFIFIAEIGQLHLKANISSPTFVTWKRSQESAISQVVDMSQGKADFHKQVLKLPVNMYFDKDNRCFQEKKSSFSYTMKTPKGEKTAGVVYIDLSKILNNKLTQLQQNFPLQKCPVKQSTAWIKLTSQCLGQKTDDTTSQSSVNIFSGTNSTISTNLNSKVQKNEQKQIKNSKKTIDADQNTRNKQNKQNKQLKQRNEQLIKQNINLKKVLQETRDLIKNDNIKQQLMKSKQLQNRLEQQINNLKKQNHNYQKQLENIRYKLQQTYSNLYTNLSNHFL